MIEAVYNVVLKAVEDVVLKGGEVVHPQTQAPTNFCSCQWGAKRRV